jgi:hypothetical protein
MRKVALLLAVMLAAALTTNVDAARKRAAKAKAPADAAYQWNVKNVPPAPAAGMAAPAKKAGMKKGKKKAMKKGGKKKAAMKKGGKKAMKKGGMKKKGKKKA